MLGDRADDLLDDLAPLEDIEAWNAPDRVLGRDPLVLVHVHLRHLHLALVLLRDFLDDWGHDAARAAPFRPEIDEDRNLRLEHLGVECAVAHLDYRIGHGERLLAR